jgi:phage shock protein A
MEKDTDASAGDDETIDVPEEEEREETSKTIGKQRTKSE